MSAARFATLVQGFFADRLLQQIQVSPNTIAAYRDTFRLLFRYTLDRLAKQPSQLTLDDLDVDLVIDFLNQLERERRNTARTRNLRLAAIRSFFRHVVMSEPAYALHCQRILAIPQKRHEKRAIEFLRREEIEALIGAPDTSTWRGRRDRTILLVITQTGLRVSELTSLRGSSVVLGTTAYVTCSGKGRKTRSTPLRRDARDAVSAWLEELGPASAEPLFPSSRGTSSAPTLWADWCPSTPRPPVVVVLPWRRSA